MSDPSQSVERAYSLAKERFAEWGVDADGAVARLAAIPVSLHCWQGDDVGGFEGTGEAIGGGLAVTGNFPGKARTPEELRADLKHALSLLPGKHRLNLHASYGEFGGRHVDRNEIEPRHYQGWIDWAKDRRMGLDFNPTYFAHPMAANGMTLAHPDPAVRDFWIEHGVRCRRIGAEMGRQLASPCVTNVWIPDGSKESPVDRKRPRERLIESLDTMFSETLDPHHNLDAVEAKLFGIGSESYVVGSHEFYLGYAITRKKLLCLDSGHFHPTEEIADKLSAIMNYLDRLLLHISRSVRWDSDHVVTFSDGLLAIAQETVRGGYLSRVRLGLDFFDASINRVAAWVIGTRNLQKALLLALLEPIDRLREAERNGDLTGRLAVFEELKSLPWGAIWDQFCLVSEVPIGDAWLVVVKEYERDVLSRR